MMRVKQARRSEPQQRSFINDIKLRSKNSRRNSSSKLYGGRRRGGGEHKGFLTNCLGVTPKRWHACLPVLVHDRLACINGFRRTETPGDCTAAASNINYVGTAVRFELGGAYRLR